MIRPRIVLHIGRNKCGSTTIQDFCLAARQELQDRGVSYTMFGHLKHSQPGIPGFQTFEELAAHAHANPAALHLVSHEFMFNWPEAFVRTAERALATCDVKIAAYLRPYDSWLLSAYSEEARNGRTILGIDDFERQFPHQISAWPYLKLWADAFGWDHFHLRSLDPASLSGGDLLTDFVRMLAIPPIEKSIPNSNVSPHWVQLELARRLAACNSDVDWQGVDFAEIEPLLAAMRLVAPPAPPVPYFTRAKRRQLVALYNADLDRIAQNGGNRLPGAPVLPGRERQFQPALDHVPGDVLSRFFSITMSADFSSRFPSAATRARMLAAELFQADVEPSAGG